MRELIKGALKASKRAAEQAVRFAVFRAPVLAALLAAAAPVRAAQQSSLDIDVSFTGIANILNLTASSGTSPGTINLSWTEPVRNAGVAPYTYDIRVSSIAQIPDETAYSTNSALSAVSSSLPPAPGSGGGAAGFVVTGLTPGVTYYFAIHEHDSGTVSDYWIRSAPINANQNNWAFAGIGTAPLAPASGAVLASSSSTATGDWTLSTGATDYVLTASTNAAVPPYPITASSTTVSSTATVAGLAPNTTYYLAVSACDIGCSAFATIGSTVTAAAQALSLSTTSVSSGTASYAWSADGNPSGTKYLVEISTDDIDFTLSLSTLSVAATSSGLSGATTYYVEIVALNAAGTPAAPSNVVQFVTLPGTPGAPTGGAPVAVYQSSATIGWGVTANATDYVLVASTNSTNPPYPITASSTTLNDAGTLTGLGPNTTYYFFVSACGTGCSAYATAGSTITDAAPAITLSTTSVSSDTVSVAFNADGNPAGTNYLVEVSTDDIDFTVSLSTLSVNATATGLSGNTTYYFEVVAVNDAGVKASPSNVVQILTLPGPPAAPASGSVIASSSYTATTTWAISSGATDYLLLASTSAVNPPVSITASSSTAATDATVAGLGPNATYYFYVSACGFGCSSYAAIGSTITAAAPAVSLSTTAVFYNAADLTWGSGGNPSGTEYEILKSTDGVDYSVAATATGTSGDVSGLTPGGTYYFKIVALNGAGTPAAATAALEIVTPTTPTIPEVPMEPLGVTVAASTNTVTLGWSPTTRYTGGVQFVSTGTPVAGELEGYAIYRSTEICGPLFVQVSTVALSASPSYADATGGVSYYYRLYSYNTVGLSTGVITVSPLGERYFFTDDCETVLAVDPQTAVASGGLIGATNGLAGDIRIVRTRRPQDDGVNILQSAQWYAYLNGVTLLPSYALPSTGHYTLAVTTQAGNVIPDLNPINTSSPFGGVTAPITGSLSSVPLADLGASWNNGQTFVNLYGKIDSVDMDVTFDSPNFGVFQVRAQGRSTNGPVFDMANISSKIITPDAAGHTAVWIFTYDPGPDNVVPTGRVYDLHGEHIADMQPGLVPNTLTWDGRMNGRTVTSGVYIYHISGGGKAFSGTIVVAK